MSRTRSQDLVAVIPARGGSKRYPGKNLAEFLGKPLIWHTLEAVAPVASTAALPPRGSRPLQASADPTLEEGRRRAAL